MCAPWVYLNYVVTTIKSELNTWGFDRQSNMFDPVPPVAEIVGFPIFYGVLSSSTNLKIYLVTENQHKIILPLF